MKYMFGNIKSFWAAAVLMLAGFTASAQVAFNVDAPRVVGLEESFRIVFITNAEPSSFDPPTINGFDVLAGPTSSRMSSTQIINGKRSESFEVSYTYILQPKSLGKHTISSATVVVDGKKYSSQPVTIEVVKGEDAGKSQSSNNAAAGVGKNDVMLKLSVNKSRVVKGEPLVATLKLYTKVPITGFEDVKFPSFNGFWSQEIETPQNIEFARENVGGVIYNAALLRRYLLVPQQTGTVNIDQSEMICMVQVQSSNSGSPRSVFDQFFSDYQTVRKRISAPAIKVVVDALPGGAPASFTGAVGDFKLDAKFNRDSVNANEAVSLMVTISGTGNINLVEAPQIEFPADFERYDVKTTDKSSKGGSGASGSKVFEYPLIPRGAGDFKIAPLEFTYYDINKKRYVTLTSGDLRIKVGGDIGTGATYSGSNLPAGVNKQAVKSLGSDVRYIRTGASGLARGHNMFFGSLLWFILLFSTAAAYYLLRKVLDKRIERNRDIAGVKNRRANKVARARLKNAETLLKQNLYSAFYEELYRALLGYASDKFSLPVSELSREKIGESFTARNTDKTVTDEFFALMDTCEFARYAPNQGNVEMHNNYERAIRLISALEGQGSESKSFIPKMKSVPVILLLAGLMTLNASVSTAATSQNDQQGQQTLTLTNPAAQQDSAQNRQPAQMQPASGADAIASAVAAITITDQRELWNTANDRYIQNDFQGALAHYLKIEELGYTSESLLYNLGNTYFKLRDYGKAILYYERVLKMDPSDRDAANNLALARDYTLDKIEEVPEFILTTWIKGINYSISSNGWGYISVIMFIAFAVLMLGFRFAPVSRLRKLSFFLAMLMLLLGLFASLFSWNQKHAFLTRDTAIVMKPVSSVKSSPDSSGKTLFILHEGTKLKILEELGGWQRIQLADGREGWIISIDIEVI